LAGYFVDSSAVAKLYHEELGTSRMQNLFTSAEARLYISRLGVVEVQSVFAGKVRAGAIAASDAERLRYRFLGDLRNRSLRVVALAARHFQEAENLIRRHGTSFRLKTLDALQLAVALDLRGRGLVEQFVASDRTLCEAAEQAGLTVLNPESQ
jgi:predicted nucleic acid-binding protein